MLVGSDHFIGVRPRMCQIAGITSSSTSCCFRFPQFLTGWYHQIRLSATPRLHSAINVIYFSLTIILVERSPKPDPGHNSYWLSSSIAADPPSISWSGWSIWRKVPDFFPPRIGVWDSLACLHVIETNLTRIEDVLR